jgi:hypothetical protein
VPLATHNQRGLGRLYVGTAERLNAEKLVALVESSMSSPIYELLKRPDELFVVEHAHLQPRFVEDSVRVALKSVLDDFPQLDDDDFVLSRQVNCARGRRRAIRNGRRTARRARRRRPRAAATHRAQGLAAALDRLKRFSSPRNRRRMFARCSRITPAPATAANTVTGHG